MIFGNIVQGVFGRWIITHPDDLYLAWSGSLWVGHHDGIPTEGVQICNFESAEDARRYIRGICAKGVVT